MPTVSIALTQHDAKILLSSVSAVLSEDVVCQNFERLNVLTEVEAQLKDQLGIKK